MNCTILGGKLLRLAAAAQLAALSLLLFTAFSANAMKIQKVTSKNGIEAWLVEDHSRPIMSMQFAFAGGAPRTPRASPVLRPSYRECSTRAPAISIRAFQNRLEDLAAKFSVNAAHDHMTVTFQR